MHCVYFRALFIKWSAVKGAFALCITQFVHTAREELNICHGKIICNSNIITNHPIDAAYFKTLRLAKCCKKWCAHNFISFPFFLLDFKTIVQVEVMCLASIITTTIPIMSQIYQV